MTERRVIIASKHGLHARPAALFTQAAAASGLAVTVTKAGKTVKAASILGVISLGVDRGDEVILSAEGANADAVLDELVALLSTDFDTPDVTTSVTPMPGANPVSSTSSVPGTPAAPIPPPSIADAPAPSPSTPDTPIPPPH